MKRELKYLLTKTVETPKVVMTLFLFIFTLGGFVSIAFINFNTSIIETQPANTYFKPHTDQSVTKTEQTSFLSRMISGLS